MNIIAPPQADIHLAEIMRQLDIGDELFWVPERLVQFEHWVGHIPFAFWLVKTLRPRRIVELGTHRGNSYCAFCQAIATLQLDAQAFAVDTWKGDIHMDSEVGVLEDLQAYHNPRFGGFSTLLQKTFDEAREMIENRSIDLLHIDGTHTYEAVKHDFENWKSALTSRSVVLFHDTCVRRDKYEVWRLWNELSAKYPSFEFRHSFGLGVLGVGEDLPLTLRNLFAMSEDTRVAPTVRALFASSGDAHVRTLAVSRLEQALAEVESRSAQAAQESTAQNRRLSEEVANLQTQLHAFTTSTVWRATWPIRRVAAAIPAPIRRFGRRALKVSWWVARHPSLTDPVGIAQARSIEHRLAPIAACSGADEESYWILVPTLDPDIFFGGYKALIELVGGLASLKRPITIVICAQDDDGSYFRYWIRRQTRIAVAFETVRIVNGRRLTAPLRLSPTDKIFAYSAWEAHLAHHMAAHVKSGLFAWLVQEYEPIFHDYSAEHAIVASAYQLPHYPIFNSTELKNYFQHHRLGIFSGDRPPSQRRDFAVFEHVLTKLRAPTLADLKSRPSRTLIFYARPEAHAKRNLFPLALIALEEMAQQGSFVGPWEFHGVGALTEMTIPLGRGHKLHLHAKMTEAEYDAFMHKVDVGLSLMYAPHPGLVAFEMASVGARVVTNIFDNRSETYLRGLSENIIPCEPTISGIKQALTEAIESLHDFSGRVRGMRINRSQGAKSWSEVFNDDFFHCEMGGFLGTDQQIVSEKDELKAARA